MPICPKPCPGGSTIILMLTKERGNVSSETGSPKTVVSFLQSWLGMHRFFQTLRYAFVTQNSEKGKIQKQPRGKGDPGNLGTTVAKVHHAGKGPRTESGFTSNKYYSLDLGIFSVFFLLTSIVWCFCDNKCNSDFLPSSKRSS